LQPNHNLSGTLPERLREALGRRAMAVVFVLLVEALLLFLLLTLNQSNADDEREVVPMSTFTLSPAAEEAPSLAQADAQDPQQVSPPESAPEQEPTRPDATPAERIPPPLIPFTREQTAAADIANLPARPAAPATTNGGTMGPPAPRARRGDSQRVGGSGPNGEPLYAAAWYREPYPDELRDYLATAQGPGWGVIICRTVAEYRVEDCELVNEYPRGSQIGRSLLAAAWQFRVRPPWIGNEPQVGAWVRIRIDYDIRRR
jgi:protein TonB